MIYFISDTHFYHSNIIKYCHRPFKDVYQMNEELISNWNKVVKQSDTIYHLGDFSFAGNEDIKDVFVKLNGNKILLRGNHDRKSVKFYEEIGFKVLTHGPIILDEYKLILSHVPVPDKQIPESYLNLHGHIHNKKINDDYPPKFYSESKHFNVSSDVIDFKPISLAKINKLRNKKVI